MPPLVPVNAGHPTKECRSDGCDGTWLQRTLTIELHAEFHVLNPELHRGPPYALSVKVESRRLQCTVYESCGERVPLAFFSYFYLRNVHRSFTANSSVSGIKLMSSRLRKSRFHPRFHTTN